MFKDVSEIKAFITWAKEQGVEALQIGEVAVTFSKIAISESLIDAALRNQTPAQATEAVEKTQEQLRRELDDELFHSAT